MLLPRHNLTCSSLVLLLWLGGGGGGGGGPTGGVCQEMSLRTGGRSHLDPLLLFLQLSDSSIDWT